MVIQFIILDLNEFDKYEQGVIFLSKAHNYTKKERSVSPPRNTPFLFEMGKALSACCLGNTPHDGQKAAHLLLGIKCGKADSNRTGFFCTC